MDGLDRLARAAWPDGGPVEVRQTHLSLVILTPRWAFKVKRPIALPFVDFTSLAARRADCDAEVRLNRRYAPGVYLRTLPLVAGPDGLVADPDGRGEPVEWAVWMRRLPDDATFLSRLEAGTLSDADIDDAADRIAALHREAPAGPAADTRARIDANARDNFTETIDHVGTWVERGVWARVRSLTDDALARLGPVFDARAARARDTHGDLRLEHVYRWGPPEASISILDCVAFNDRFRYADPASDLAFLVMDLQVRGAWGLAERLVDRWVEAASDPEARAVIPFYVAYRSVVRAKVAGLLASAPGVDPDRLEVVRARARRHWSFALASLAAPAHRPCLVGVGGLPGTGKSTVARGLAARAGFEVIRSDVVRKELAGLDPLDHPKEGYEQGLYSPAAKDRVYAECLRRARTIVDRGGRAIVDAS